MENNYKPTGKTYEIKTLDQLMNVATVENLDMLNLDFYVWMHKVVHFLKDFKEKNPKYANKLNSKIVKVSFVWTDDGKNMDLGINLKSSTTGEMANIVPPESEPMDIDDLIQKAFDYAAENSKMEWSIKEAEYFIDKDHMKSLSTSFKKTL